MFHIQVVAGTLAHRNELVYPIAINHHRAGLGHALRDIHKLAYGHLAVQQEPGNACERTQQDFRNHDHDYDLAEQGELDKLFAAKLQGFGLVRVVKEYIVYVVLEMHGYLVVHEHRNNNDYRLVQNIDNEVGGKLRDELGESEGLVKGYRERGRDALAKIVAVQEVRKHGTEGTAKQREHHDGNSDFRDAAEEPLLLKDCRRNANKDADDAVVERGEVGNTVERIGAKARDNSRQCATEHGREDGAEAVEKNGDMTSENNLGGNYVYKECRENQPYGIQYFLASRH